MTMSEAHDGAIPVTERLAAFAAGLRWDGLPDTVRERVGILFADWLGNAIGGQPQRSTELLAEGLATAGMLDGTLRAPGAARATSPYATAFLSGSAAHALDFDDTHAPAELHPGAPVIAAALTAAQMVGADVRTLFTGVVAGYEVMTRVALGLPATQHADRGFHLTATTGVFGAAAAAGRVLGLPAERVEDAFGTALSRAAGSGQHLANGAWTKRYHVGAAAADGLLAAILARTGFTGASQAFEGERGFFRMHSDAPRPDLAVAGLGSTWQILDTGIKPYPCCRAIHSPLDGLRELMAQGLRAEDVARIEVGIARRCADIVGIPNDRKRDPRNAVDGQFSAHFCLATTLVTGTLSTTGFDTALRDPRVRDLMRRIEVGVDEEAEAAYPKHFAARMRVERADGTSLEVYEPMPLGEPERMVSPAGLREKFTGLAASVLGEAAAARLADATADLAGSGLPIDELLALATPQERVPAA